MTACTVSKRLYEITSINLETPGTSLSLCLQALLIQSQYSSSFLTNYSATKPPTIISNTIGLGELTEL
jgi:hypothetical protein